MEQTVGRFAPTPSGRMHLGNVLCYLLAWLAARSRGGRIVLRIEDLDTLRAPLRYARALEDDLRWLGLDWDEGGLADAGPHGPYCQSRRGAVYAQALEELARQGRTYPCFCSRAELHAAQAPHLSDGRVLYAGTCRELSDEEIAARAARRAPAVRLRVPEEDGFFPRSAPGAPAHRPYPPVGRFSHPPVGRGVLLPAGRGGGRCAHGRHPGGAGGRPGRLHRAAAAARPAAGPARPGGVWAHPRCCSARTGPG